MKILIDDGLQIQNGTGIGKYTSYLYEALKKNKDVQSLELANHSNVNISSKKLRRLKYLIHINSKKYRTYSHNYDFIWFTNYVIPFIRNKNSKYIVTIHDLVAFKHPETLPIGYRIYIRLLIKYSISKADYIFTVSNTAKNEIIAMFPKVKDHVFAFWPGIYNRHQIQEKTVFENNQLQNLNDHFLVYIGTVEKRKNIGIVINAFLKLKEKQKAKNYKLVIAGRPGYGYDEFVMLANTSPFGTDIIFPGYVSESDSILLYKRATAFVFPSKYEGFGSNQTECMQYHLPIILSDIPTNREISRDYGLYFNLNDEDELVAKMYMLINKQYDYKKMNQLADKYLKDFDWNFIAKKILEVLKKEK